MIRFNCLDERKGNPFLCYASVSCLMRAEQVTRGLKKRELWNSTIRFNCLDERKCNPFLCYVSVSRLMRAPLLKLICRYLSMTQRTFSIVEDTATMVNLQVPLDDPENLFNCK